MFKSIAVFCGSKKGNDPVFAQHAEILGKLIAQQNITLIYGGGNNGLMGIIANAVLQQAGKVIGVMPEILNRIEHQHKNLTQLHVVENMHTRKKMMYDLCDAAIILPGGFGTMDELFEIITWNNLSIHNKKIILLNSAGYYDILIKHIELMQSQGFLYENKEIFSIHNSPETIFSAKD
jgi:uncharacterized protein (TIGR00730 family)